jgi:hypothetical protein
LDLKEAKSKLIQSREFDFFGQNLSFVSLLKLGFFSGGKAKGDQRIIFSGD